MYFIHESMNLYFTKSSFSLLDLFTEERERERERERMSE